MGAKEACLTRFDLTSPKEMLARKVTALFRRTGLMGTVRSLLAGEGIILMLHEVQHDPAAQLSRACLVETLEWTLRWLRREGWEIVSLSEASDRLSHRDSTGGRFAVFTFDDGYRDTLTHALPIMEEHGAAFTIYVSTHAVTREIYSWWLGLRELFRNNDAVSLSSRERRYKCASRAEKLAALKDVTDWVGEDFRRAYLLAEDFRTYRVNLWELNESFFLTEGELQAMARRPLVTVGGHTTSHAPLSCLDEVSAQREIVDNRRFLQRLVEQEVDHFAYPYGNSRALTLRDAGLVASAGYRTAVTTKYGVVRSRDACNFLLPRIEPSYEIDACALDGRASGIFSALAAAAHGYRRCIDRLRGGDPADDALGAKRPGSWPSDRGTTGAGGLLGTQR